MRVLVSCREEIKRLKAENPDMAHKEAFSTAAKNVRSSFLSCFLVQLLCKFGSLIKLVNHGYWLKKGAFLKLYLENICHFQWANFPPTQCKGDDQESCSQTDQLVDLDNQVDPPDVEVKA